MSHATSGFGPWPTVYGRFRGWRNAGVFTALLEGLIAEAVRQGKTALSLVRVDSRTARAHHDAAGMLVGTDVMKALEEATRTGTGPAKKGDEGERNGQDGANEPEREERRRVRRRGRLRLKEALFGRSRGGLTSKIQLAADRKRRPLSFVLTAGQAADGSQFIPVLKKIRVRLPVGPPRARPGAVAADKAHSARANRSYLRKRHIRAVTPEKKDQAANRKKKAARAGGLSATTPTSTRNGTPSSARSTG